MRVIHYAMSSPCAASRTLDYELATVKPFGVPGQRIRFHASQPQQRPKRIVREPWFVPLGLKRFHNGIYLAAARRFIDGEEHVRLSQVPLVFGNLVFQDQMIAKLAPA